MRSRMVVVETLYHATDDESKSIPHRYSRKLKSDEEPFVRTMRLTETWVPLERGWLGECSALHLAAKGGTVEVSFGDMEADCRIPSGETNRYSPVALSSIHLRCSTGTCKCTVTLLPE